MRPLTAKDSPSGSRGRFCSVSESESYHFFLAEPSRRQRPVKVCGRLPMSAVP